MTAVEFVRPAPHRLQLPRDLRASSSFLPGHVPRGRQKLPKSQRILCLLSLYSEIRQQPLNGCMGTSRSALPIVHLATIRKARSQFYRSTEGFRKQFKRLSRHLLAEYPFCVVVGMSLSCWAILHDEDTPIRIDKTRKIGKRFHADHYSAFRTLEEVMR